MRPSFGRHNGGEPSRFKLWEVPTAVWACGFFLGLAFGTPFVTGTGGFGLGFYVVLVLYIMLLRRSRHAWSVLVVLNVLSLTLLLVTQQQTSAPWVLHIFTALAIVCLLWPSTGRYVTGTAGP